MSDNDLYSILGVLPIADNVVIRAAYKALAQLYHPDRWQGSPSQSHQRMSAINEAYRILGDAELRKQYDQERSASHQAEPFPDTDESNADAFNTALEEVENRWSVACSVYPDLNTHRKRLAQISASLAFSYVTTLLSNKSFSNRTEVASQLEQAFLVRFFGSNPRIVAYGRDLVLGGQKKAARALNELIDVLGSETDPDMLIQKIEEEHGIRLTREREAFALKERRHIEKLVHAVRVMGYYKEACELAHLLGFMTTEIGGGFFSSPQVHVKSATGEEQTFNNAAQFTYWVKTELCKTL